MNLFCDIENLNFFLEMLDFEHFFNVYRIITFMDTSFEKYSIQIEKSLS